MRQLLAAAAFICVLTAPHAQAQVYLRGQSAAMSAAVNAADVAGVYVAEGDDGKVKRIIGWDRVREVRGEHGAEAAKFSAIADQLWRARSRVERGDFALAEPGLDQLVMEFNDLGARSVGGPTGAVLYEGLLRCRLHRGAQASAVFPFLRWRATVEAAQATGTRTAWIGGTFDAPFTIDAKTGLCPALPPIFLGDAAVLAMASSSEWNQQPAKQTADSRTAQPPLGGQLGLLYRAAAHFESMHESNLPAELDAIGLNDAERLVADIVIARVGDDAQRAAARASLTTRMQTPEIEPWLESWCRVGIGRSLLRETSEDEQRRGILQLLHAPARLARVSPYLASVALADAAVALNKMGDSPGATTLKAELEERYPRRSAAAWSPLREIKPAQGTAEKKN